MRHVAESGHVGGGLGAGCDANERRSRRPPESLPANLDDSILDPYRERSDRLVGRGRGLAGPDVEPRAVARVNNPAVLHASTGEGAEVMRAHVLDREVLTVEIEYGDVDVINAITRYSPGPNSPTAATSVQSLIASDPVACPDIRPGQIRGRQFRSAHVPGRVNRRQLRRIRA